MKKFKLRLINDNTGKTLCFTVYARNLTATTNVIAKATLKKDFTITRIEVL